MTEPRLDDVAARAVELARRAGATEVAAEATRTRDVDVTCRDGEVESLSDATERSLAFELHVDGRYGVVSTSDLRPAALATFVADAVALTRALAPDPDRRLPDPLLYRGRAALDLDLVDAGQAGVTPDERARRAAAMEAAARAAPGAGAIVSCTTSVADRLRESSRATSNGFVGSWRGTVFSVGAHVTVKDADDRRPDGNANAVVRHRADLPAPEEVGRAAAARALARLGAVRGRSGVMPIVVENRAAGRLANMLLGPMSGKNLQQKLSFLDGKLGQPIASKLLALTDAPHARRGLGSRLFDAEGLAAQPRVVIEDGVSRSHFLDTYYARKLGVAPTSGTWSNLAWKLGERGLEALLAAAHDGLLVTAFVGGNDNGTTGDFSLGVSGHLIRGGARAEPVGEMVVSGNQLDFWKHLVAVGDDPYPYTALRTPSLLFDAVAVAGG